MLNVRQMIPSRIPNPAKTDTDTKSFCDRYLNSSMTTVWSAGGPEPGKQEDDNGEDKRLRLVVTVPLFIGNENDLL